MKLLKNNKKTQKSQLSKNGTENLDSLKSLLFEHQRKIYQLGFRIDRLKDLLTRKSALKIAKNKIEKMKKQLSEAEEEYSFSQLALDQILFRISQIS